MKTPGLFFRLALLLVGMIAGGNVFAQYVPSWWVDPAANPPVLDPNASSSNYSPVTTGQLKWIAFQAKRHLDNTLSGGAGTAINDIVDNFKPITGVPYSQAEREQIYKDNMSLANIGQLKVVAEAFYARLSAVGYDTKQNLIANGYPPQWTDSRPWNSANPVPVSENYRPFNLGQLKLVFSFDIIDINGNGTKDYLEGIYPAALATADDFDADGIPNALDAFPHDPTRSVALVSNPNDHTGPTIAVSQPAGVTLQ